MEEFLGGSPVFWIVYALATKMRPSVEEFLGGSPCLLDCLCFSYKNEAKRGRILRRQSLSSGLSML